VSFLLGSRAYAAPPPDFVNELVLGSISQPISMSFLPDGRILILKKGGEILIGDPSAPLPLATSSYMTLTNINTGSERGLIDIALDPDFGSNGYFYLYYMPASPQRGRIARFTHQENAGGLTSTASPASEVFLWEDTEGYGSCCHYGGGLDFGPDGNLYLTLGDHFDGALAQDLTKAPGSIIRIEPDGDIPSDNFGLVQDGPGGIVDAIYAYGLRNPFRSRFDLPTGRHFIGEVGGNDQNDSWEDVHIGRANANFGWPACEGPEPHSDFPNCDDEPHDDPIFAYPHAGSNASITGGIVYRGSQFPTPYVGAYFYGDFVRDWIRYLTFDPGDPTGLTVSGDFPFEPNAGPVVAIEQGPEGSLYYLTISGNAGSQGAGDLRRFVFDDGNQAPSVDSIGGVPLSGAAPPLEVAFDATVSDAESEPLTYEWDFGDATTPVAGNVPVNGVVPTTMHTFTSKGLFDVLLRVFDPTHTTLSNPIRVTVGTPPTAIIDTPSDGALFRAGDIIAFTGSSIDPDETDPGGVDYSWTVKFHHDNHFHPVSGPESLGPGGGSFNVDDADHDFSDDTSFAIDLVVTDSDGLQGVDSVEIEPDKVDLTFDTVPAGLSIAIDGIPKTAPFVKDTLIDFQHTITAPLIQCLSGVQYEFSAWSDAGAASHDIVVPDSNATLTASYTPAGPCTVPVLSGLVMHLKGDAGVSTSGNAVTSWADQTTSGNDLVPVSGSPTLLPAALNGHSVVSFDGVDDGLGRSGFAALPTGSADRSVFLVVRYLGDGFGGFTWGNSACNETFGVGVTATDADLLVQGWCGPNDFPSSVVGQGAGWITHSVKYESGNFWHYRDGALIGSGMHAFATASDAIRLGIEQNLNRKIAMDVAEVLVYDRALTETERQQIEDYLSVEYFGGLPVNQPPVANNDNAVVPAPGDTVIVDVLANDSDPDGSLDPATVAITTAPAHGAVVGVDPVSGEVSYQHTDLVETSDAFGYTVDDDDGATSNEATVIVGVLSGSCSLVTGGLVLQLEADAGVDAGGGTVSSWIDQSGLGNDLQAAGDPQLLATGGPHGGPAIALDGAGDKLERIGGLTGLPGGSSDRTLIAVLRYIAAQGVFAGVSYGAGASNQAFGLVVNGNSGLLTVQGWGSGNDFPSAEPGVGAGWLTQGVVLESDVTRHFKDGAQIDSDGHSFSTSPGEIVIGEEIAGLGFSQLDVAAVFAWDRALSDPERLQVQSYVDEKYFGVPCPSVNQPPVAVDDAANVDFGGNVVIDVLTNDSDSDGVLDPTTVAIVSQPMHALSTPLSVDPVTGEVTYVHDPGSGAFADSFTYEVDDEVGDTSNTATVVITVPEASGTWMLLSGAALVLALSRRRLAA